MILQTANELKSQLKQFSGTCNFYALPLIKTRYTDGIQYLATAADCFWMVTDVSVIAKSLMNRSHFVTVDFKKYTPAEADLQGYSAVITYSDGNDNTFECHRYHVTDFPLDALRLFFVENTLLLPSEY